MAPSLLLSLGHNPRLGGHNSCLRDTSSDLGGHDYGILPPWHRVCYRLLVKVSDSKLRLGNRSTKKLLFDAFIYPRFVFKFYFFTFSLCELSYKQSNELQRIVAYDANCEYNYKRPIYPCVRREVPNIFLIKITDVPTNNTNCTFWPTEKLNCQYLLVSNNI